MLSYWVAKQDSHELHRWHAWKEVWPWGLHWNPKNNNWRYLTHGQNKAERQRGFTEKLHYHPSVCVCVCVCVHFGHLCLTLSLPIRTFQVIKKNNKRSRLYLYTSVLLFFSVYNIFILVLSNQSPAYFDKRTWLSSAKKEPTEKKEKRKKEVSDLRFCLMWFLLILAYSYIFQKKKGERKENL